MRHQHLNRRHSQTDGEREAPVNRVLRGEIAEDVAAGSYIAYVRLDTFTPRIQRGPVHCCRPIVRAHPEGAAEAPIYAKRGDPCWVVRDEQMNWVMVNWEPA